MKDKEYCNKLASLRGERWLMENDWQSVYCPIMIATGKVPPDLKKAEKDHFTWVEEWYQKKLAELQKEYGVTPLTPEEENRQIIEMLTKPLFSAEEVAAFDRLEKARKQSDSK